MIKVKIAIKAFYRTWLNCLSKQKMWATMMYKNVLVIK